MLRLTIFIASFLPAYSMVSPPTFQITYTQRWFDFHNISSWSGGGGPIQSITDDSGHPFAGRRFAGGDRSTIRGTRAFGSGYPYGNDDPNTVAGRPFPYGVWPLYWGDNFKGSAEYGAHLDTVRPGGPLVIQLIAPIKGHWETSSDEVYYIITDKDTALAMMTSFATWCHVVPEWPKIYEPDNPNNTIGVQNVVRYYRASSFALAFEGYTNAFALNTTTEASLDESTPLPDLVTDSNFYQCVEGVIANAIPIINGLHKKSNLGLILGVIFGIFGAPILICFFIFGMWLKRLCLG